VVVEITVFLVSLAAVLTGHRIEIYLLLSAQIFLKQTLHLFFGLVL